MNENPENDFDQIFQYPSINALFLETDSQKLKNLKQKFNQTRENLDSLIRRGNSSEAESARKAVDSILLTLEFLDQLEKNTPS